MKKWLLTNVSGFTLVELMVVVAIIGILSAIAVPNFKKYQAKSKQSEAKIQLAAVYATEVGANSDYDTYATCLTDLGYEVPPKGYYWVGFAADDPTTRANVNSRTTPTVVCTTANTNPSGASFAVSPSTLLKANNSSTTVVAGDLVAVASGTNPTTTSFTASTAGNISGSSTITLDKWQITQTKSLTNSLIGY